jgi:superoxide dismutase
MAYKLPPLRFAYDALEPHIDAETMELHAYYLKYRNRRPDYLHAWWNVVAWDVVDQRLQDCRSGKSRL